MLQDSQVPLWQEQTFGGAVFLYLEQFAQLHQYCARLPQGALGLGRLCLLLTYQVSLGEAAFLL